MGPCNAISLPHYTDCLRNIVRYPWQNTPTNVSGYCNCSDCFERSCLREIFNAITVGIDFSIINYIGNNISHDQY